MGNPYVEDDMAREYRDSARVPSGHADLTSAVNTGCVAGGEPVRGSVSERSWPHTNAKYVSINVSVDACKDWPRIILGDRGSS